MHACLLSLLLIPPCPPTTPSHAKAVAMRALKRLEDSLATKFPPFESPTFYKLYPFSRQQLAFYGGKDYPPASGYLVVYTVRPRLGPHGLVSRNVRAKCALFVSTCDSVTFFRPTVGRDVEFSSAYDVNER